MQAQLSKIKGQLIFNGSSRPVASLEGLVIDPESGKIGALTVHKKPGFIISPTDIIFWRQIIKVQDGPVLIEQSEVVRVNRVIESEKRLLGNKVYTESGQYLGKVKDYIFDLDTLQVTKIFVTKTFFGLIQLQHYEIPADYIIEVFIEKVLVKDLDLKLKEKEAEVKPLAKSAIA